MSHVAIVDIVIMSASRIKGIVNGILSAQKQSFQGIARTEVHFLTVAVIERAGSHLDTCFYATYGILHGLNQSHRFGTCIDLSTSGSINAADHTLPVSCRIVVRRFLTVRSLDGRFYEIPQSSGIAVVDRINLHAHVIVACDIDKRIRIQSA